MFILNFSEVNATAFITLKTLKLEDAVYQNDDKNIKIQRKCKALKYSLRKTIGIPVNKIPLYDTYIDEYCYSQMQAKSKSEEKAAASELAEMLGRDHELKKAEAAVQAEIAKVAEQDDSKLTPEERAKRWEK